MNSPTGLFGIRADSLKLLLPLLVYKFFVFALIFLSIKLLPSIFNTTQHYFNFHWPMSAPPDSWSMLKTWDGEIFLHLSRTGYQEGSPTTVSFPLWPFLIHLFAEVTGGHYLAAGLILANLFSLAGLILFHHLIASSFDEPVANISLLLLLCFPGAIFLSFMYSEALFLFLSVLFFICLKSSRYRTVFAVTFLMSLTRSVGIFCLLPLIWQLAARKEKPTRWLCCLGPLSGMAVYFLIMHKATGNPFTGFEDQKKYLAQASLSKIIDVMGFIKAFFNFPLEIHGYLNSALDRLWFLWFAAALFFLWKRNKTYFIYALAMGLVPAMSLSFMAYTRYFLVVFPVFVVTAELFVKNKNGAWLWLTCAVLFSLQIIFLLRHVNNYWVG